MKGNILVFLLPLAALSCYISGTVTSTASIGEGIVSPSITATSPSISNDVMEGWLVCGTDSEHGLNLRGEAGTDAEVLSLLVNGERLDVVESLVVTDGGLWLKVETVDGRAGWVNARYVCPISS